MKAYLLAAVLLPLAYSALGLFRWGNRGRRRGQDPTPAGCTPLGAPLAAADFAGLSPTGKAAAAPGAVADIDPAGLRNAAEACDDDDDAGRIGGGASGRGAAATGTTPTKVADGIADPVSAHVQEANEPEPSHGRQRPLGMQLIEAALSTVDFLFCGASVCTSVAVALCCAFKENRTLEPRQRLLVWGAICAAMYTPALITPSLEAPYGVVGIRFRRFVFETVGYGFLHSYIITSAARDLDPQLESFYCGMVVLLEAGVALFVFDDKHCICVGVMATAGRGLMRCCEHVYWNPGDRFLVAWATFFTLCAAFGSRVVLDVSPMLTFLVRTLPAVTHLPSAIVLTAIVVGNVTNGLLLEPEGNQADHDPDDYPRRRPPPARRPRGKNRMRVYRQKGR
jgi:hypothetical protein